MKKVYQILKKLFFILLSLGVLSAILYVIHRTIYSFTPWLTEIEGKLNAISGNVKSDLVAGVSIGALVLTLLVVIFPLMIKNTDKKEYLNSLRRGLISASIFYISNNLFIFMESLSLTYLIISVVLVMIITFILIEAIVSLKKKEKEISERSKLLASMAAGLAFGILLKLLGFAWNWVKSLLLT
jgi:hypothetical protein